jgi:hypothetical protein
MSTLVAVAYEDAETAEKVRQELIEATKEHLLRLEDAVVVECQPDGKIKLHQSGRARRCGVGRPHRAAVPRPAVRHGHRRGDGRCCGQAHGHGRQ